MAPRLLYKMDYQSDIKRGGDNGQGYYSNFPVDIQAGFENCVPDGVVVRTGVCNCSPRGLFLPRRVEGKFEVDGKCVSVTIPVPFPDTILDAVDKMKTCGAICVNVLGERWNYVPPNLALFTPDPSQVYGASPAQTRNVKVSGIMNYTSDMLGQNQSVAIRYEARPVLLTGAVINTDGSATAGGDFEECHGPLEDALCAGSSQIKARRLIAVTKQTLGSDPLVRPLSREVPIKDSASILSCIQKIGAKVACVRYEGESISFANLFI